MSRLLSLLLLLAWTSIAWSQVQPLDGPSFSATLQRLESDNAVFLADGRQRAVALDDLLKWGKPAEVRRGSWLLLADGSRIAGEVTTITPEHVEFESVRRPGIWTTNRLPRTSVSAIVFSASANPMERDRFESSLLGSKTGRVLLTNGDTLAGVLREANAEEAGPSLRFQPTGAKESLAISQSRISAISLASRGDEPRDEARYWLGFEDGSLLKAKAFEHQGEDVKVTLALGSLIQGKVVRDFVDPEAVPKLPLVFVQSVSSRVTYLSDLKTIGFKHVPLLDWQQEFAADRCLTGSRLRAGGEMFVKGVSMPATSRLAYDIPAGSKRFCSDAWIDDSAQNPFSGTKGSAIFRVFLESPEGEWKPAFETKILRGGEKGQTIDLPLGSARRLALVVDMATDGDVRDYADWLNARFVK